MKHTKEDQDTLLNWLDPKNPPLDEELKNWKKTISNSTVKLVESEVYPLTVFCQKLVCLQQSYDSSANLKRCTWSETYKKFCILNDYNPHFKLSVTEYSI